MHLSSQTTHFSRRQARSALHAQQGIAGEEVFELTAELIDVQRGGRQRPAQRDPSVVRMRVGTGPMWLRKRFFDAEFDNIRVEPVYAGHDRYASAVLP